MFLIQTRATVMADERDEAKDRFTSPMRVWIGDELVHGGEDDVATPPREKTGDRARFARRMVVDETRGRRAPDR